jgi:hypothetical protein
MGTREMFDFGLTNQSCVFLQEHKKIRGSNHNNRVTAELRDLRASPKVFEDTMCVLRGLYR